MNTCPNCGKIAGIHSSILQGCACQWRMAAPPQRHADAEACREWVGLTPKEELDAEAVQIHGIEAVIKWVEAKLKSKNGFDSTEKNI